MKGAPRRDDLSRAAYYVALTLYGDPKIPPALKTAIQTQMMALLGRAGFSVFEANVAFLNDSADVLDDINGWLARRWYEQGKHLGGGREALPAPHRHPAPAVSC